MCEHTILFHICGHLAWCPEALRKCEGVINNYIRYNHQPSNPAHYSDQGWNLPAPTFCYLYWSIEGLPTTYIHPSDLRYEGVNYANQQKLTQKPDFWHHFPVEGEILELKPEWTRPPPPHYKANVAVRWVPFTCGCEPLGKETDCLPRNERNVALAYELGNLKHFVELPEGCDSQGLPYPGVNAPLGPRAGRHLVNHRPEGSGLFEPRGPGVMPPRGPLAERIIVNIPNTPRGRGGFVGGVSPGRMGGDSSQFSRGVGGRGRGQGRGRGGQGGHNWGGQVIEPGVASRGGHGGHGKGRARGG